MTGEYVFEEAPVRPTTQEVLTQRYKGGEICNGIGSKVVKLSSKEIQKPTEEKMRWQREPSIYMSRQEDTLTLLRLWLPLHPREPRRPVRNQAFVGQVVEILLGDGRADPITLDPTLRQTGPQRGSPSTGRSPLRFRRRRRLLRPLQSRRLLFHHCHRRGRNGAAASSSWWVQ